MREIKFRAWDKEMKQMCELTMNDVDDTLMLNDFIAKKQNRFIFMQYTGLLDKNGKEIYEGDVVVALHQKKAIVFWDKDYACFGTKTIDEIVDKENMYYLPDIKEVIGNIYENPELIQNYE